MGHVEGAVGVAGAAWAIVRKPGRFAASTAASPCALLAMWPEKLCGYVGAASSTLRSGVPLPSITTALALM
jgi:hypothetical protein